MMRVDGKMKIQPKQTMTGLDGWVPISEKNLPFELTASFLFTASRPGVPLPIKLPDQLKPLFPLDRPVDESSGERIAAWARGGVAPASRETADDPAAPDIARLENAAALLIEKIGAAPDKAKLASIQNSNADALAAIKAGIPDRHADIMSAIAEKANEFYTPPYASDQGGGAAE